MLDLTPEQLQGFQNDIQTKANGHALKTSMILRRETASPKTPPYLQTTVLPFASATYASCYASRVSKGFGGRIYVPYISEGITALVYSDIVEWQSATNWTPADIPVSASADKVVLTDSDEGLCFAYSRNSTLYYMPIDSFRTPNVITRNLEYSGFNPFAATRCPEIMGDGAFVAYVTQSGNYLAYAIARNGEVTQEVILPTDPDYESYDLRQFQNVYARADGDKIIIQYDALYGYGDPSTGIGMLSWTAVKEMHGVWANGELQWTFHKLYEASVSPISISYSGYCGKGGDFLFVLDWNQTLTDLQLGCVNVSGTASDLIPIRDKVTHGYVISPYDGMAYGVYLDDHDSMYMISYMSSIDLSEIVDSWDISHQDSTPAFQLNAEIDNFGYRIIADEKGLFNPGNSITMSVTVGNSEPLPLGVFYIDEVSIDAGAETASISSRTISGYFYKDQKIGKDIDKTFNNLTAAYAELIKSSSILSDEADMVGKCIVQSIAYQREIKASKSDSIADAIDNICTAYSQSDSTTTEYNPVVMYEDPKGTVYLGQQKWLMDTQRREINCFEFDDGKDVFERSLRKMADNAYSVIVANGTNAKGDDLNQVVRKLNNFAEWYVPNHKALFIDAPVAMSQRQFEWWVDNYALNLSNSGVVVTFTSKFRPYILPGDTTGILNTTGRQMYGVISEVNHHFSRKKGYTTEFSVASNGYYSGQENTMKPVAVNGLNRKQTVVDVIHNFMSK